VSYCPRCGHAFEIELPVEPLWDMASASLLLPMKPSSLKRWLSRHRDDPGLGPRNTWVPGAVEAHANQFGHPVRPVEDC
jgi:hypothetical protein